MFPPLCILNNNSVFVPELYFNMDPYYYNLFYFDSEYYLVVKYI
jgi:hypothetical protein